MTEDQETCPLCGLPIENDEHECPRDEGGRIIQPQLWESSKESP